MTAAQHDGALESRWNGFECRQICGLGVFSLRCTATTPVSGPAPYTVPSKEENSENAQLEVEDIVDEALYHFKTLVLLPKLRIDKAGDRVLFLLVCFLHESLQRIQAAQRADALQILLRLRYSFARQLAQSELPELAHLLRLVGTAEAKSEAEAYLVQLFTEAALRLLERVFLFPSSDGLGSKWWLLFGRRRFLT